MLNRLRDKHRYEADNVYWNKFTEIEESLDILDEDDSDIPDIENLIREIDSAVDSLPPQCRQIFIMAKRHGMKYREIADTLHLSPKTVENQIGIALSKIRELMKNSKNLWGKILILCLFISRTLN